MRTLPSTCVRLGILLYAALTWGFTDVAMAAEAAIHRTYQGPAHRNVFLAPSAEQVGGYDVVALPDLALRFPYIGTDDDDGGLRIGVPLHTQDIALTNRHREANIKLKIVGIKARLSISDDVSQADDSWRQTVAGAPAQPNAGCSALDAGGEPGILSWKFEQLRCVLDLPKLTTGPVPARLTDIQLAYEIDWGDIDKLPNGIYTGRWTMPIGHPEGLWLAEGATSNDAAITFTITLQIAHDIQVSAEQSTLELTPPGGTWDKTRDGISTIAAATTLTVSSAPEFTVHVACSDQVDSRCALRHRDATHVAVPVDVHIELPGVQAGADGALPVANPGAPSGTGMLMTAERALQEVKGHIRFSVIGLSHIKQMLSHPGRYEGQLSVVFDASPPV